MLTSSLIMLAGLLVVRLRVTFSNNANTKYTTSQDCNLCVWKEYNIISLLRVLCMLGSTCLYGFSKHFQFRVVAKHNSIYCSPDSLVQLSINDKQIHWSILQWAHIQHYSYMSILQLYLTFTLQSCLAKGFKSTCSINSRPAHNLYQLYLKGSIYKEWDLISFETFYTLGLQPCFKNTFTLRLQTQDGVNGIPRQSDTI